MKNHVISGRAFIDGAFETAKLTIEDDQIVGVERAVGTTKHDLLIVPGFIDIHVHGGAGADFMDGRGEAVEQIVTFHAKHGTTSLAATTLSGSTATIAAAVRALAKASRRDDAAEICGVHLEGPFLSSSKAGAQDPASIRAADARELDIWLAVAPDVRCIVTVAPETEATLALIAKYRDRLTFSIGHTDATYEQTMEAIAAGATHFTHLFNAMPPLNHRQPGPVAAALTSDGVTAEIIADGIHLHPSMLLMTARMMSGRVALVTDAMRAAGMAEGTYKLYDYDVEVRDGAARLSDGTLAGSILTMDAAVRNMVNLAGLPLEKVIPMATEVPARILGIDQRKGRIAEGYVADLVVLDNDLEVERVFIRGKELPRA